MKIIFRLFTLIFINCHSFCLFAQKGYFIPNALIQPTHSNAKQFKVSVGIFRGLDIHGSYSINNRILVFASAAANVGTYGRKWMGDNEFTSVRNDNSFSLGVGFFKTTTSDFHFENSFGFSLTKSDNFMRYYSESISFTGKPSSGGYSSVQTNSNYWGAFYQFTGLLLINDLEIGLASRFVYNRYTNFTHHYPKNLENGYVGNNFSVYSVEPVGIISYNLNKYKISAQTGLAVGIPDDNSSETFINLIGRLSLQYSFNSKNK
ncbi:MAG: hypothetical protein EAZ15_06940 [Sphingobacteriales bacterium]|nr:MAG: hypothetical protein EAZ15_06940 [Sphingobacteriales bacterium]